MKAIGKLFNDYKRNVNQQLKTRTYFVYSWYKLMFLLVVFECWTYLVVLEAEKMYAEVERIVLCKRANA